MPQSWSEVDRLLKLIDEGYERKAWHGPNLRGSLRGLSPQVVVWRPARGRHNILEIAIHAAYWKYAVRRRLTGEKRGSFPIKGSNWFGSPARLGADDWKRDLQLLADEHRQLRAVVAGFPPSRLHRKAPSSIYTFAGLIEGIAAHDVYHAGQIQLLKRLYHR